jgi:PBP1b-binding outer membrane lipoprotein LpoB
MKKILAALLIISLVFVLIGCGPAKQPDAPDTKTPPVPPTPLPETGESSVDDVGSDITGVDGLDQELDDSSLDGLDDVLADLENI